MKILRGFVLGVVQKGTSEKPWAMVGLNEISLNRNGFEETNLVEFMVAGKQYQEGLHNAYRAQIGSEVFAPYRDELDEYQGKSRIRYSLQGAPVRLMDQPAVTSAPAASAAPAAARATA